MQRKGIVSGEVKVGRASSTLSLDGVSGRPSRAPAPAKTAAADPFSTPARRRRIIADVVKFLLRQYYIKACENVIRFRKWTAASLVIQRAWRCHVARKRRRALMLSKRFRASIILQCLVRCSVARRKLKRLRLAEWTRRAIKLAKALQAFWRGRLLRRRKKREQALHRARMLKKKAHAALEIERCFRGMRGRRLARHRLLMRSELHRRRHLAAIKIQSCARRRRALLRVEKMRQRRRAVWRVGIRCKTWYRRFRQRRHRAAVAVERILRGFLARRRVSRARKDKLRREREEAERRHLELLREEAATRRIEVRLAVNTAILRRIGALGPAEAVLWSLKHNILRFHDDDAGCGYSLGPVLLQVVGTVESVFPSLVRRGKGHQKDKEGEGQSAAAPGNIVDVDEDSKCIKLRKWDDGASKASAAAVRIAATPRGLAQLPFEWKKPLKCGDGAEVAVDLDSWAIELKVKIASDAFSLPSSDSAVAIRWTVVTIVLEAEQEGPDLLSSSAAGDAGVEDAEAQAAAFKFKFKDTVVLLQPQPRAPPSPPPSLPKEHPTPPSSPLPEPPAGDEQALPPSPQTDFFDDSAELSEPSPQLQDKQHRITIVIEPNWDAFARTIQRRARAWAQLRIAAARSIQTLVRRRIRLRKWRRLVVAVLARAHQSARLLQSIVRGLLARHRVQRLRLQVCARMQATSLRLARRVLDDLSDHKFALASELDCWRAFGIQPVEAHRLRAAVPRCPAKAEKEAEAALGVDDLAFASTRCALLRDALSFAKLPAAPPGTVSPASHLVCCPPDDELLLDVTSAEPGVSLGTVMQAALPSAGKVKAWSGPPTQPLSKYGLPNLLTKIGLSPALVREV